MTLLAPLARLLEVDLNTLLCFRQEITQQELRQFCSEAAEAIRQDGPARGFEAAREKIRQYPGCGALLHAAAMLLDGAVMMAALPPAQRQAYDREIEALYERAAESDDADARDGAGYMLASRCIGRGEYDRAQEYLERVRPRRTLDAERLRAQLLARRGKTAEAARILEGRLLSGVNEHQQLLVSLIGLAAQEGDHAAARRLAGCAQSEAELFGLWEYGALVGPLEAAVARKDTEESLALLEKMLRAVQTPWNMAASPLCRHTPVKRSEEDLGGRMLPALLQELETDPRYAFLQGDERFAALLARERRS